MFAVIDNQKLWAPVKSGFKTAAQANAWCKKNLPLDITHLWGDKRGLIPNQRYFVMKK